SSRPAACAATSKNGASGCEGQRRVCRLPSPSQSACASCATSPTGGGKSTPVGAGQVVVRQTCSQLRITRRSPGLTAVRLAPPVGELARRPQGGETERGATLRRDGEPNQLIFHPRQCKIRAGPSASRFGRGRAFCIVDSGRSLRFVIGRAPAWPRAARELHNLYLEQRSARNERHYSRRSRRHTALPAVHCRQQTGSGCVRQAHVV